MKKDLLKESVDNFFEDVVAKSIQEDADPQVEGMNYKDYMAFILFVDSFASEMEELGLEKDIHGELTETVPDYIEAQGFDIDKFIPKDIGTKIADSVDSYWNGVLTVADLVRFDKNAAYRLALQSIGHGVSVYDDMETEEFIKSRNLDLSHEAFYKVGDIDSDVKAAAMDAITEMGISKENTDSEEVTEGAEPEIKNIVNSFKDELSNKVGFKTNHDFIRNLISKYVDAYESENPGKKAGVLQHALWRVSGYNPASYESKENK